MVESGQQAMPFDTAMIDCFYVNTDISHWKLKANITLLSHCSPHHSASPLDDLATTESQRISFSSFVIFYAFWYRLISPEYSCIPHWKEIPLCALLPSLHGFYQRIPNFICGWLQYKLTALLGSASTLYGLDRHSREWKDNMRHTSFHFIHYIFICPLRFILPQHRTLIVVIYSKYDSRTRLISHL